VTLGELALILGILPEQARVALVRMGLEDAKAHALGKGSPCRDNATNLAQLLSARRGSEWVRLTSSSIRSRASCHRDLRFVVVRVPQRVL
jgi:hypothetical protein